MVIRLGICPSCDSRYTVEGKPGEVITVECKSCHNNNRVIFTEENLEELMVYPLDNKFELIKIVKNNDNLDKYYMVEIPILKDDEIKFLKYLEESLLSTLTIRLDEIEFNDEMISYLKKNIDEIIKKYKIEIDNDLKERLFYYINRDFIGFGKIDPVMKDPHIEDISCDGPITPLYIYHREYGSLKSNIVFDTEAELSAFVVKLSQKCGKHISLSTPMLDATMPDGSRIQMTLSGEVTTKGSTFTIRKFRSDHITPTDLIGYNTMSVEMIAYLWIAVENGVNALIAGSTASGKTSTLNAFSLFIPRETKIVSIEETREINLPHENWIPGVTRTGFGEIVNSRLIGEIDLFDLMKAALRQRPEYILVGEIRGAEAYVLFQAMATGHTTYSTVHADSIKALIHRLEGKPINVPRAMLQSLDVVLLQTNIKKHDKNMRRCRQIIEIIDLDSQTNEILTNEVFRWNSKDDKFEFLGKSYVLDHIRVQYGLSKDEMKKEMERRVEVLKWMQKNNIRAFKDFARIVSSYADKPEKMIEKVRTNPVYRIEEENITSKKIDEVIEKIDKIPLNNNEVKRKEIFNFISKRRKKEKILEEE
ncbi:MAG: type II/IV secretion system ATPase subunit [Candidatus Heimdallarchaeota archaeon]